MPFTVITRIRLKPGAGGEFERLFVRHAELISSSEPGSLRYELHRPRSVSDQYVIFESYVDEAAYEAHRDGTHLSETRPGMYAVFAEPPEVEMLDGLNGSGPSA